MSNGYLEIIKLLEKAPALLEVLYKDAAKPGVEQAGKALGTVIGLGNTVLLPIALLNAKASATLERNMEKYRKQIEHTPVEHICEVPPEIGVPIMEKLGYVSDDTLSDLYINLLAKASIIETAGTAHPSFVNIIGNLSPDEALLLQVYRDVQWIDFLTAKYTSPDGTQWKQIGNDLLTALDIEQQLKFSENVCVYLSNFEGLGIVQIRRDIYSIPATRYDVIEQKYRPEFDKLQDQFTKTGFPQLTFDKGKIVLTPFGRLFVHACLKKL